MKKWNAKVKCITACRPATTEGQIYDIVDGRIIFNNGYPSAVYNSIEELNQILYSKFELVKENKNSIHIYENNKIITAVLKENGKVIKTAIAKCSQKDEYEFNIGAKIALDRLIENEVKIDKAIDKVNNKQEFSLVFTKNDYNVVLKTTLGKIYDSKNGCITYDDGFIGHTFKNFKEYKENNSNIECYEIKKVKRFARNDEYIQTITACNFGHYKKGDILKITDDCRNCISYAKVAVGLDGKEVVVYNEKYVVLEGYKPIEKKEEFKPHLEFLFGKEHYGTIGEETNIIDVLGNKMKVGDTVILYENTKVLKVTTVCKNKISGSFVMGVAGSKFVDGKSKDNNFVWTIIKEKSYEEIDNGAIISKVKYVKERDNII